MEVEGYGDIELVWYRMVWYHVFTTLSTLLTLLTILTLPTVLTLPTILISLTPLLK